MIIVAEQSEYDWIAYIKNEPNMSSYHGKTFSAALGRLDRALRVFQGKGPQPDIQIITREEKCVKDAKIYTVQEAVGKVFRYGEGIMMVKEVINPEFSFGSCLGIAVMLPRDADAALKVWHHTYLFSGNDILHGTAVEIPRWELKSVLDAAIANVELAKTLVETAVLPKSQRTTVKKG